MSRCNTNQTGFLVGDDVKIVDLFGQNFLLGRTGVVESIGLGNRVFVLVNFDDFGFPSTFPSEPTKYEFLPKNLEKI
jgi:hypothetical protein